MNLSNDKDRKEVTTILLKLLANEYVLRTKSRNAHRNLTGPDFHAMHGFFESQYNQIDESIDEIAEHILSIGLESPSSLTELIQLTHRTELTSAFRESSQFVTVLLADHEALIRQLREDATACAKLVDEGTSDFLFGLMEAHEKMAEMLRARLP